MSRTTRAQNKDEMAALQAENDRLQKRIAELEAQTRPMSPTFSLAGDVYFQRLFESNMVAIFLADLQGNIRDANDAFLTMLGYSRAELQAGIIHRNRITPPEYAVHDQKAISEVRSHSKIQPYEKKYIHKNGQHVPVLVAAARIDPSTEDCICFALDLTARVQGEDSIRFLADASSLLSESLDYETTLASLGKLVVPRMADWYSVEFLTPEGALELISVQHVDPEKVAWALQLREVSPPADMNAPTGAPNVLRTGKSEIYPVLTEEMLVAGARTEEELVAIRAVGFSSIMIVPLTARERTFGVITFVSAESGRHYTNDDMTLAEELAQRAALAVDNANLYREAQETVRIQKELDNLKDLFVSIVGHELRTPLTAIKGYAQMIERSFFRQRAASVRQAVPDVFDRAHRSLANLIHQTDSMTDLIGQLLDFSRLQNGQFALQYTPEVDLMNLVQQVVEQRRATTADHTLIVEAPSVPLHAMCDEVRLEQVVHNLVRNAIKYSPAGTEVRVGIERHIGENGREEARIFVRDQGCGISPEDQAHIFDRFYRVHSQHTARVDGLGLGLYISSVIVSQHGGQLWLTSTPGEGSTFYVDLPLQLPNVHTALVTTSTPSAS